MANMRFIDFIERQSKLLAEEKKHDVLTTEHIIYIALQNEDVRKFLNKYLHINPEVFQKNIELFFSLIAKESKSSQVKFVTGDFTDMIDFLRRYNSTRKVFLNHYVEGCYVGWIDLFEILLKDDFCGIERGVFSTIFLKKNDVDYLKMTSAIVNYTTANQEAYSSEQRQKDTIVRKKEQSLDFLIDLNQKAKDGKVDKITGRQNEIDRISQILIRRSKNNPVLVGEPGVGKTAIVEGLAHEIISGNVHEKLKNCEIFSVDLSAMLAGTTYRGDFENKFKKMMDFVANKNNAILFFDEMHIVMGAGASSSSSMDLANMLKPYMARDNLKIIGATTYAEFKQIAKDGAFARRIQKVDVHEPTPQDAVLILKKLKPLFEKHHNTKYSDKSLEDAVLLSVKHLSDRFLPDKAIDILDEAGAYVAFNKIEKGVSTSIIEKVIAKMANIPEKQFTVSELDKMKNLRSDLSNLIIGQDHAINDVIDVIELSKAGLRKNHKTLGSFLFAGPTGVGKTELGLNIAKLLDMNFLRLDMSEYDKDFSSEKLVGSPPGYVGYGEGGVLTNFVQKHPHSVILFDEFDKSHQKVRNYLLQIMDHATLTDGEGKKADFRNCIIILTSNDGQAELFTKSIGLSQNNQKQKAEKAIIGSLTPEFRNRLDKVISFNQLSITNAKSILLKLISELQTNVSMNNNNAFFIELTSSAQDWIVNKGFDENLGARPMQRAVDQYIGLPLSREILYGQAKKGGVIQFDVVDNELKCSFKEFLKQNKKKSSKIEKTLN